MDYPRDNVFTYLFSTYRRTAGVVFTAILVLAVPLTIVLLSNEQDIRQQAANPVSDEQIKVCMDLKQEIERLKSSGVCNIEQDTSCEEANIKYSLLNCDGSQNFCVPRPPNCKTVVDKIVNIFSDVCREPEAGWCN